MSFTWIPVFASVTVHEEIVDLVGVVLLFEHEEVLLAATRSFHSIFVYFFGHNQLGIRLFVNSAWQSARICSVFLVQGSPNLFAFRVCL